MPKAPDDIGGHECICYSRAGDGRSWSFSDGSDEISVRIAPRLVANNAVAVHRAVLTGAVLPCFRISLPAQTSRLAG